MKSTLVAFKCAFAERAFTLEKHVLKLWAQTMFLIVVFTTLSTERFSGWIESQQTVSARKREKTPVSPRCRCPRYRLRRNSMSPALPSTASMHRTWWPLLSKEISRSFWHIKLGSSEHSWIYRHWIRPVLTSFNSTYFSISVKFEFLLAFIVQPVLTSGKWEARMQRISTLRDMTKFQALCATLHATEKELKVREMLYLQ